MKKLIIILIIFASCSGNDQTDCLAEKNRINEYYDNFIKNNNLSSNEVYRLNLDRKGKLKDLSCD